MGKSTLLNALVGHKVSIVSDKPQTTRTQVRAVVNRPGVQLVFVDTPGIHKPVTALGERLNATAGGALADIDVVCLVLDATRRSAAVTASWPTAWCPSGPWSSSTRSIVPRGTRCSASWPLPRSSTPRPISRCPR